MGDQQQPHVLLGHEIAQKVEDLRLRRDVERGRGLVRDQQARVQRDGGGDADALALAAGQLVGIGVEPDMRQAHAVQPVARDLQRGAPVGGTVDRERFDHLRADGLHRVERCHRLLKDHRDVVAAHGAPAGFGFLEQVRPVEPDRAARRGAVGQKPHQRQRGHRLARAAFADKAEHLALHDPERDVMQDGRAVDIDGEGLDLDHASRLRRRGSSASRSPSPRRFSPSTITTMASPGRTASIGFV